MKKPEIIVIVGLLALLIIPVLVKTGFLSVYNFWWFALIIPVDVYSMRFYFHFPVKVYVLDGYVFNFETHEQLSARLPNDKSTILQCEDSEFEKALDAIYKFDKRQKRIKRVLGVCDDQI